MIRINRSEPDRRLRSKCANVSEAAEMEMLSDVFSVQLRRRRHNTDADVDVDKELSRLETFKAKLKKTNWTLKLINRKRCIDYFPAKCFNFSEKMKPSYLLPADFFSIFFQTLEVWLKTETVLAQQAHDIALAVLRCITW